MKSLYRRLQVLPYIDESVFNYTKLVLLIVQCIVSVVDHDVLVITKTLLFPGGWEGISIRKSLQLIHNCFI